MADLDHLPPPNQHITAPQIRAARALLGWRHGTLAEKSGLSPSTITTAEAGDVVPHDSTIRKLRAAFEAEGIVFIPNGVTRPCPVRS